MNYQTFKKCKIAIAVGAIFSMSLNVNAQVENANITEQDEVERIIIKGQKYGKPVQEIPMSITSFGEDQLENRSIVEIETLSAAVPNLVIGGQYSFGGGSSAKAYIRGLPGVGIYIDDIYQDSGEGLLSRDMAEVERVTILKGPQGTLFGKETMGGAILIYTKKPQDEFGGNIKYGVGTGNLSDFNIAVNVPFTDELRVRFSGTSVDRDGYIDNVSGDPDGGDVNSQSFSFDAVWEPINDFSARLKVGQYQFTQDSMPRVLIGQPHLNDFESEVSGYADTYWNDSKEASLSLNWNISDKISLKSITGYNEQESNYWIDYDGIQKTVYESSARNYSETFSNELQILGDFDNFNWVIGSYYQTSDYKDVNHTIAFWAPNGYIEAGLQGKNIETKAVFGDVNYEFTEKLSVSAGVRYSEETVTDFVYNTVDGVSDYFMDPVTFSNTGTGTLHADNGILAENAVSYNNTNIKLGVSYQESNSLMYYATYAEGFSAGGARTYVADWDNDNATPNTPRLLTYQPESVSSYEIGLRADWMENQLRTNVSMFFVDYSDIQLNQELRRDDGSTIAGRNFVGNAAEAEVKGLELEVVYNFTDDLIMNFAYGYTDSAYTDVGRATDIAVNSPFQKTPENSFNIALNHFAELTSYTLNSNISYGWKSEQSMAQSDEQRYVMDAYGLLNARFNLSPYDGDWSVAIYGNNLSDELYYVSALSSLTLGGFTAAAARGREFGIEFKTEF